MENEMRDNGSNIPNMVEFLQKNGWKSYKHHDNWIRADLKDWEQDLACGKSLNDAYLSCLEEVNELPNAIKVLQKHLRKDKSEGSYYYSWQANIAMAFYDEMSRYYPKQNADYILSNELHEIANQAAKNFLDNLIKE